MLPREEFGALNYIDYKKEITSHYPYNPNGTKGKYTENLSFKKRCMGIIEYINYF